MQYVKVKASNREEALEKSGLRLGQAAFISDLMISGNVKGDWTVHPEFELMPEGDNHKNNGAESKCQNLN